MKARRSLTAPQAKEMLRRYAAGDEHTAKIAADYGVDPSYPTLLAKRSGIPLRRPNRLSKRRLGEAGPGGAA